MSAVKEKPIDVVIEWGTAGSQDDDGTYTPAAGDSLSTVADVQPSGGQFVTTIGGDVIKYKWDVILDRFDGDEDFPDDGKITFLGREYKIISFFAYTKHIEIKC